MESLEADIICLMGLGACTLLAIRNTIPMVFITQHQKKITNRCNKVLQSNHSKIFNIPVAKIGLIFYLILLGQILQFPFSIHMDWTFIFFSVLFANLGSVYYFSLLIITKNNCSLCTKIHMINGMMGIFVLGYFFL